MTGPQNSDTARLTYTPGTYYSFTYMANDGSADGNVATVTITVDAADPAPSAEVTVSGIDPSVVS